MAKTHSRTSRLWRLLLLAGAVAGLTLLLALRSQVNQQTGPDASQRTQGVSAVLLQALADEAVERRNQRRDAEPSYVKRVDHDLNEGRINILLYGYGESHEPPLNERVTIGSVTIASIDTDTNDVALVSLTHDIRAPEVERYLRAKGEHDGYPVKIDRAYPVGGFGLMRKTLEHATGLAIDYQVAFSDTVIARLIDDAIGPLVVEIQADFEANPFYLDGKKFPARRFLNGVQAMDGITVIQYIKTVPLVPGGGYYGAELEHNARKHLVFKALANTLRERAAEPGLLLAILNVLMEAQGDGTLSFDFKVEDLLTHQMALVPGLAQAALTNQDAALPGIRQTLYVVDSAHGDGGVQWVTANESPIIKAELALGRYPDRAVEVPLNANPYGDLVTDYWGSVRALVKRSLSAKP